MYVDSTVSQTAKPGVTSLGERRKTSTFTTKRTKPIGTLTTTNYLNQLYGLSQVSGLIENSYLPGKTWRTPSPYRRCDISVKPRDMDMTWRTSTGTEWLMAGTTPVSSSVGPGNDTPFWGTRLEGGIYLPDVSQNVINRAVTEALQKLNDQKFNLATALAEGVETAGMIASWVKTLVYSYRACRRGNYQLAAKLLFAEPGKKVPDKRTSARNAWLQLQYGWLPLMADIYGAVEAIKRGMRDALYHVKAERNVTEDYGLKPKPLHYVNWSPSGMIYQGCQVVLYARISDSWLDTINSLGLINPLEVIWELVPYSFVIDWVIPVGSFLNALTAPFGTTFTSGTQTTKVWGAWQSKGHNISAAVEWSGTVPTLDISICCMDRIVLTQFPTARLFYKSPFSTKHIISAAALVHAMR